MCGRWFAAMSRTKALTIFVVAHAAMQPAQEEDKLHAGGDDG